MMEQDFMKKEKAKGIMDRLREEAKDKSILEQAKEYAFDYMETVMKREVFPSTDAREGLRAFDENLPQRGADSTEIIKLLHEKGSPATVAQTGGRYFGFVNGGILPAALSAKWLTDVWDQNAALYVISPTVSKIEEVTEGWITELLGFPEGTAAGFVSGSSTATLCGITAGRNAILKKMGYDVAKKGLFGAPEVKVVIGEGAHSTVFKALSILGLGSERVTTVPMDEQGRMRADMLPELDDQTLLILQAGNVNSGAFDPFDEICEKGNKAGAWIHVDGAFGLWAAASEKFAPLTKGLEKADSWSVDGHKTLNAPYDNGIILCRNRQALTEALHMTGSYIITSEHRDNMFYTLDMSRRARAVEIWAALKSLGKEGVCALLEDLYEKAVYFGESLRKKGFRVHNDIVFNQVLVSYGSEEETEALLKAVQDSGVCWLGSGRWENRMVIRISVCSYRTTMEDIDLSVEAFCSAVLKENGIENPVEKYIQSFSEPVRERLQALRTLIQEEAPLAKEKIAYGMVGYDWNGPFVYFGGFKNHIGFFPTPSGVEAFKDRLAGYETSKGTIQFSLLKPLPEDLIREILQYRMEENHRKAEERKTVKKAEGKRKPKDAPGKDEYSVK